jgi:hypothetical protein
MLRPLLMFCLAPLLLSCAANSTRPLRFVDCTRTAYCTPFAEWPNPSWSEKHEALYSQGVMSIVHEMACGKMVTRGRRLAYVSAQELSIPCAAGSASLRHVPDREHGNRLLAAGDIDSVVEFERSNASRINGGIEVPLAVVYYGKVRKHGADSRLEGMDNYLIVQTEGMTELRLVSRSARD